MSDDPLVYLNGDYLPLQQARVSVLDRGFLFGDGVYEVIPCYRGKPFRLQHHFARLAQSLNAIRLDNPLSQAQWREIMRRLLTQHPEQDRTLYLQITRGSSGRRELAIPKEMVPTVFAMSSPLKQADPALASAGISVVTLEDIRWQLCNIKTINILANQLLRQQARDKGCDEAILIRDGFALEGTSSNLFIVHQGTLITPPAGPHLLPGVTRDLVLELAAAEGAPRLEAAITVAQLQQAEEIWLTSSSREIMPVTRLDGKAVANGLPGPIYRQTARLYQARKATWQAEASW
jgi:D-alanine transaminase